MNSCSNFFWYALGGIILVGIIGVLAVAASNNQGGRLNASNETTVRQEINTFSTGQARVQLPTPTPEPPLPTPEWMAPSFAEICDENGFMTTRQRQEYAQALAGKKIVGWIGTIYAIERWDVHSYVIKVDMRGGRFFRARQVEIVDVGRELIDQLKVNQQIVFNGTIRSIQQFTERSCNPIYIIEATVTPQWVFQHVSR